MEIDDRLAKIEAKMAEGEKIDQLERTGLRIAKFVLLVIGLHSGPIENKGVSTATITFVWLVKRFQPRVVTQFENLLCATSVFSVSLWL